MGKIENIKEKVSDFLIDHEAALYAAGYAVGVIAMVPLCYVAYKWQAKMIGKEVAKHIG